MNRKRIISILLSMCIILTLSGNTVFAAESDSKEFEQAILNAKSVITVSDDYKNFSHTSRKVNDGDNTITVWDLYWENENSGESISIEVDSYGNICDYSSYKNDNESGLAKVKKEDAEVTAKDFVKKVIPNCEDVRVVKCNNNVYSNEYDFICRQYVNDIPVEFVTVNVGVNKYTGEVSYYNGLDIGYKADKFPDSSQVIDTERAKDIYLENIQEDFSYYTTYDYKAKKRNNFAWYTINGGKGVDAVTGEILNIHSNYDNSYKDYYGIAKSELENDSIGPILSDVEKAEINTIQGLISSDKAQEILKEKNDEFEGMKIQDISLSKDSNDEEYIWQLYFDNGSGQVDAETGEILSFNIYYNDESDSNSNMTYAQAKDKAEYFLKKIVSDKFGQTKLLERSYEEDNSLTYGFNYIRQINGKNYMNNMLSVFINKNTGKIVSYDNVWYKQMDFPDVNNVISKKDAFNIFNEKNSFGLHYTLDKKNNIRLVYDFLEGDISYYVDAVTGNKIDRWGKKYDEEDIPEYTDITGHWCEKIVKELLNSGYYIKGDKFNPNYNISQVNFFRYMLSKEIGNCTDDELYDILKEREIVKDEEKNPKGAVTNKDAAKFIVRYLGYGKLAEKSSIFKNTFNDSIDEENLGYASICYGLNIIKGDSEGNFNQNYNISNATAAVYIYNIVSQGYIR
ncbi:YcdB/YcdC domain-containing protein [uncultured Clostridium sp.]|uniref:YcdB/YcdC domain-containing protein n=1 Tax=uncultured Clostridium sp. TaxID=59620 RepID=UPI0025E9FA81|nr:YcdB/YcdC domain-containing protein [uncultured Clostridium sp.]